MKEKPVEIEIRIPNDSMGFVELECELCGELFRVKSVKERMWCPVCGKQQMILRLLPKKSRMNAIQQLRLLLWGVKRPT